MELSLKDDVTSLSNFKANFPSILKSLQKSHHPLVITQNGTTAGVFMDMSVWEESVRKMNLLKLINEGEVSLRNEKSYTTDEVEKFFAKKFDL